MIPQRYRLPNGLTVILAPTDGGHAVHAAAFVGMGSGYETAQNFLVLQPVFFAVLIIIVVFTPLFTLEGVEGKLFIPMALSITFAMGASLLVAMFLMPVLATYVFKHGEKHRDSPLLAPLARGYSKGLAASTTRKAMP